MSINRMDGVSLPTWDIHNDHDIGTFSKNAVILETNRLMYGVHDGNGSKRDITIGPVDAVHYIGGGDSTVWYDELAPIGFFENGEKKSSPNHE